MRVVEVKTNNMKRQLTQILNLPGVIVKSQKKLDKTLVLELENLAKTARCPNCQQISYRLHQNHLSLIKDLPWGEQEVLLRINRRQFKCDNCVKPFSEKLDFVEKRKKYTNRYARFIIEQVIKSDLLNVAINNNLTQAEVESMLEQVATQILPINLKELKRLGIDEISLVKGQGEFIVVLVDLDARKLIGLVKDKKSKAIEEILNSWGEEILNKIEEVSLDLCKMYKIILEKLCPNAVITVDRFHLTKLLHEELNQGRIDQKKTAESLEVNARAKLFASFKGGKYVLLKRAEELKESQKEKLLVMKEASALIGVMHSS